jgi:methionine aminopeptidase type I
MSITNEQELIGMQKVSEAVAYTLKEMINYAQPGMTTKEVDEFGAKILSDFSTKSAPYLTYGFPGWTCISVDNEFCHGIPTDKRILKEGDLINIDVSAELNGYWADNGGSFIIGKDIHQHGTLVEASKDILQKAINNIKGGVKIADIGFLMETEAKKRGFKVIKTWQATVLEEAYMSSLMNCLTIRTVLIPDGSRKILWWRLKPLFQRLQILRLNLMTVGLWLEIKVASWLNTNIPLW